MHELRLVAVSEDGSYAVLVVPGRSGRFSLPIDDRLRAVARGQFSRLAQYEIEVESPLRPKEIQERIRAGETADEIADTAGVPLERVRWFEAPVLAERAYRARRAAEGPARKPEAGPPAGRVPDAGPAAEPELREQPGSGEEEPRPEADRAPAAAQPGRRAAGGRARRAPVPSWDEIMFGSSRPRD